MTVFIGFSLSFCIKDILEEKVSADQVLAIISSTKIETSESANRVFDQYMKSYWSKWNPETVRPLFDKMLRRTVHPRIHGLRHGIQKTWVEIPGIQC